MRGRPFSLCTTYARWVLEEPAADFTQIDRAEFEKLFDRSLEAFPKATADQADLTAFAAHGGKLMIDHGIDDPLIPVDGTIDYYERLKKRMGEDVVSSFCRIYLGPGDNHGNCQGNGPGITETDGMRAMMDWVEKGIAPGTMRVVQIDRKSGEALCEKTLEPF